MLTLDTTVKKQRLSLIRERYRRLLLKTHEEIEMAVGGDSDEDEGTDDGLGFAMD